MSAISAVHPLTTGRASGTGLQAFADRYDVLLCDLWGVMHDGCEVFRPAVVALERFRAKGGTVVFITNAPRPREPVLAQIAGLGLPDAAFDAIVTSGDVTIAAIAARGPRPIYHIGPPRDRALFDAMTRQSGRSPTLTTLAEAELVVVTSLSDDCTETPADYADQLAAMRARKLPLICANPDIVVHVGEQLIYCGGALAQAYEALGGETVLAGKPHAPIYEAALALAGRHRAQPLDRRRVLAIGDGLVTDGVGAARQDLDFLFVTSGIHRDDLHPGPAAPLDEQRYAEAVAVLARAPVAAVQHLSW